jgi:hypothetical protein
MWIRRKESGESLWEEDEVVIKKEEVYSTERIPGEGRGQK